MAQPKSVVLLLPWDNNGKLFSYRAQIDLRLHHASHCFAFSDNILAGKKLKRYLFAGLIMSFKLNIFGSFRVVFLQLLDHLTLPSRKLSKIYLNLNGYRLNRCFLGWFRTVFG